MLNGQFVFVTLSPALEMLKLFVCLSIISLSGVLGVIKYTNTGCPEKMYKSCFNRFKNGNYMFFGGDTI